MYYMGLVWLVNEGQVELLFLLFLQPCVCVCGNCKIDDYDEKENVQKLLLRTAQASPCHEVNVRNIFFSRAKV